MSRSDDKIKRQIVTGTVGSFAMLWFWRLLGRHLAPLLPASAAGIVNCAMLLSLGLIPLLIMLQANDSFAGFGLTFSHLPKQILIGILIGLAMASVLTLLPMSLGLEKLVYTGETYSTSQEAIRKLFYFIFCVGLVEEFIFRGFLYHKLKEICLSDAAPTLISSLIFGLFHLTGFNLSQVIMTALIGAFFCLCREKIPRCTILSLAIAHGIHDWMIRVLAGIF
ncbi:MAG: CPBP family intramembrane metalloprotease [Oscillospiraceae bacterium]|nr:CPBP family intramembrane metalloprotease [Oscillospiraceae bacterium]